MKTSPNLPHIATRLSLRLRAARSRKQSCLLLLITIFCLLQAGSLYAQATDRQMLQEQRQEDLRKQREAHRQSLQKKSPVQTRQGDLWAEPNPGSIHVNRDSTYREYTPQELVDSIFVKGGACVYVGNVDLYSHGWDGMGWTDDDNRGLGYFSRGDSNFEFAEGLVLSTGGLVSIEGPNESDAGVEPPNYSVTYDYDLAGLVYNVTNVSVLTFDFVPVGNVIQFRYIFASEEYLHFANTGFNDVFGFFIAGPGIGNGTDPENIALLPSTTSGDYMVSINNVNWGQLGANNHNCPYPPYLQNAGVNPEYYVNIPGLYSDPCWLYYCDPNDPDPHHYLYDPYACDPNDPDDPYNPCIPCGYFAGYQDCFCDPLNPMYPDNPCVPCNPDDPRNPLGPYYDPDPLTGLTSSEIALLQTMEFNGRTVVLTASATVTPCQTYTLKLAVGNVSDEAVQSGVFLEARSFDIGDNVVNYGNAIEGMDLVYRGCQNNKFVVTRPVAEPTPATIALIYGGTAVNGSDISTYPGGLALPSTVVIPAGSSSVEVYYQVTTPPTGYKTFTITTNCPCGGGGAAFTKTIHIYDPSSSTDFAAEVSPSCPGTNSGMIHVTAGSGGSGHYESSIDGGVSWHSSLIGHTGLAAGTYVVHARDSGSCFASTLTNIVVTTAMATTNAGPDQSLCTNVFTMAAQPLAAGQSGRWTVLTGSAAITNIISPITTVTLGSSSATLRWTLTYAADCEAYDDVTLTVTPYLSVSLSASPSSVCSGGASVLTASISGSTTTPTTYTWYRGVSSLGTTTVNTYTLSSVTVTAAYSVTVQQSSCTGTSSPVTVTITAGVTPAATITASDNNICAGTSITYTVNSMANQGSSPGYQWRVNASPVVGEINSTFVYEPDNGDIITCVLTSSDPCASPNPVTSNAITMTVTPMLTPSATIIAVPD